MPTLDSVLNWLVPTIVILVFAAMFYNALKSPIDRVIRWIRDAFGWGAEKIVESINPDGAGTGVTKYIKYE